MAANLRIGELSRRTGVSTDLLRAWERRYGLLDPVRSPGGYRLYTAEDELRIRSMTPHSDVASPPARPRGSHSRRDPRSRPPVHSSRL